MALYCKFLRTFQRAHKVHCVCFLDFFAVFQTISLLKNKWKDKIIVRKKARVLAQIKLFWITNPIFQIALWPTAKCSMAHQLAMAHWLRITVLKRYCSESDFLNKIDGTLSRIITTVLLGYFATRLLDLSCSFIKGCLWWPVFGQKFASTLALVQSLISRGRAQAVIRGAQPWNTPWSRPGLENVNTKLKRSSLNTKDTLNLILKIPAMHV